MLTRRTRKRKQLNKTTGTGLILNIGKMYTILKTNEDIFLVEFHAVGEGFIFSGSKEPETLGKLTEKHGKSGILKISRYNAREMKFKKVKPEFVQMFFKYETNTIEELKKINYLK